MTTEPVPSIVPKEEPAPSDLRIHKITVENFMMVKFIQIYPDPNMNYIAGQNGEGKTSFLDAMMSLFLGDNKSEMPEPIHKGKKKAIITADLKDFLVQKVITPSGSKITVKDAAGVEKKPAGTIVKRFLGKFSFDPLAFYNMKEEEQIDTLLSFMGIAKDIETIDAEVQEVKDAVLDKTRQIKDLKKEIGKEPPEEVIATNLDAVTTEYQVALSIEDAQKMVTKKTKEYTKLSEEARVIYSEIVKAQKVIAAYTGEGSLQVKEKYKTIEENNVKATKWDKYEAGIKKLDILETEKVVKENDLIAVQDKRTAIIEKKKLPIPGLTIKEKALRFKNGPLRQASSSERIQISTLLAMKLNPGLKVLRIVNGPLLDEVARKTVKSLAEKYNFQIWMEVINLDKEDGFVIEDGNLIDPSKVEKVETEVIGDPVRG